MGKSGVWTVGPAVLAAFLVTPCRAQGPTVPPQPARGAPEAGSLEGIWTGELQAGDAKLHLVLHILKNGSGGMKATLDSLDQGVYGTALAIGREGQVLHFEIANVSVKYQGTVSPDHKIIDGSWSQGGSNLPLAFHREAPGIKQPDGAVAGVEGLWQGALETNGMRLRLQLHVAHDREKNLVAALDSLDQAVSGVPATGVSGKGSLFHFEIPSVGGIYDGILGPGKNLLTGTWKQGDRLEKLEFRRSDEVLALRRPQNPVKPYPYREEEVTIRNEKAQVVLSGTLTVPRGAGPFPAALLLAGQGALDRDEFEAQHRPFLVLADHLTRKGMAVLRYDKRGVGKSTGEYRTATTSDLARDAELALEWLAARKEIDARRTGLVGHSEGGLIAPLVAGARNDVAWLVLMGTPATRGEETMLVQAETISRAAGIPAAQLERSLELDRKSYALILAEEDPAVVESRVRDLVRESGLGGAVPSAALDQQVRLLGSPGFRSFLGYDPLPALKGVKCPVLVVSGEKDLQVPPARNVELIRRTLEEAGNTSVETMILPGLNHNFQHGQSGLPTESQAIEETFAEEALGGIAGWLRKESMN